ncbi:MAG: helix-turn-helix domain-containing protein [Clostridia bacterium]|nr:helix-turn-helix domain-containing protein [Clostridia bacterium]
MNKIGERIAVYRKTNGMTQDQLANVLGVSPQTVSKWETGTTMPDIMLLPVIAEVFETSVDSLFGSNKKAECKSFSTQNISDEMLDEFFKSMSCFWLGFEQNVSVTPEERANDTREFLKAHKNTQMLVMCNCDGNGVYGDSDMALTFNKSKEDIDALLQGDDAWTVLKRFADGEFFFGDKFIEFIKQNAHSTDI